MVLLRSQGIIIIDRAARRELGLVQVGGKEPGLMRRRDKMVHPYLTGMDDGHAETSESGVE
jgi:hypothetical protein